MIKQQLICDICNITIAVNSYRINVGLNQDPSGNGYNIDWEYKEFCPKCKEEYQRENKDFKIYCR